MSTPIASVFALVTPLADADHVLAWANRLAADFSAAVDVGFVREDLSGYVNITPVGVSVSESTILELRDAAQEAESTARAKFEAAKTHAPAGRFRRFVPLATGYGLGLIEASRTADLVVMQAPGTDTWQHTRGLYLAQAVIDGGALVFAPPESLPATAPLGQVAVAWDGSREAAAAMRGSIPFLKAAEDITLVTLDEAESGERLVLEAESYLAAHHITADVNIRGRDLGREGRRLLDAVAQIDANLLVMGAYGRAQWVEGVFGGTTEHAAHHCPIPLLMAH